MKIEWICKDTRKALREMSDESANCSITSPPYWGLRDYGLPPSIWDGKKSCKHQWDSFIKQGQSGGKRSKKVQIKGQENFQITPDTKHAFCSLCGAWRGCLGLEPTFELYIKHLCDIYDEVWRVLRKDGTCWVNLGDSYAGSGGEHKPWQKSDSGFQHKGGFSKYCLTHEFTKPQKSNFGRQGKTSTVSNRSHSGRCYDQSLPAKSLCLIPQRFAIEMVNRGWILRNTIIWHKPNPMPSSAKDRFTIDFEYVFFFVKSNKTLYWIRPDGKMVSRQPDAKAGKEDLDWKWGTRKGKPVKLSLWKGYSYWFEPQYEPQSETSHPRYAQGLTEPPPADPNSKELNRPGYEKWRETTPIHKLPLGRNKRTVWTVPTQPYPEAHFATFPQKLVEPMVLAGCPEFVCKKCGIGRRKVYDTDYEFLRKSDIKQQPKQRARPDPFGFRGAVANAQHYFKGYTDCGCNAGFHRGIILDLFAGAGTTNLVAFRLGRDSIYIDLKPEYLKLAKKRLIKYRVKQTKAKKKS